MAPNMMEMLALKGKIDAFAKRHPMFPRFLGDVKSTALQDGTVIDFMVTTPDGAQKKSNIKLSAEDVEFFMSLGRLGGK
ncbi:hypothetical protein SAMN06296386_101361 [Lachnospiraceae bacterium]|nr:hypothetical protein SAMN06296386_101361 [Lachnospiraceae bacterium]